MTKGEIIRLKLLRVVYDSWRQFPSESTFCNVDPILHSIRQQNKEDITRVIINQTLKGMQEEELMEFAEGDENNFLARITPKGREVIVNHMQLRRNRFLATLGAVLGTIGFVMSLGKLIWDVTR